MSLDKRVIPQQAKFVSRNMSLSLETFSLCRSKRQLNFINKNFTVTNNEVYSNRLILIGGIDNATNTYTTVVQNNLMQHNSSIMLFKTTMSWSHLYILLMFCYIVVVVIFLINIINVCASINLLPLMTAPIQGVNWTNVAQISTGINSGISQCTLDFLIDVYLIL